MLAGVGIDVQRSCGAENRAVILSATQRHLEMNCKIRKKGSFPSSKMDFWPFLKLHKMEFGQKKFMKLIYLTSFFGLDIFKFSGPLC